MDYKSIETMIGEESMLDSTKKNGHISQDLKSDDEILMMSERESMEETNTKVKDKQKEYMQSFTIHGLSRICTGNRSESYFWTFVVLIGISLSSYVIYELVSKYFKYEVYTTVRNHVTNENYFPGITFCDFELMKKEYFAYCGLNTLRVRHNHPKMDEPCNYSASVAPYPPEIKNILKSRYEWSNGFFHVRVCGTLGGQSCSSDEYIQSVRSTNHACFRVNWNGKLHDAYSQINLEFEMNKSSGVKFSKIMAAIHQHDVREVDLQHTTFIEPSKTYQVIVKKTEIKRLPHPFPSDCLTGKGNDIFPGKYSRMTCLESLNFKNMVKFCGDTIDHARRHIPKDLFKKHHKVNQTMRETLQCMRVYSQRKVVFDKTLCPVPCQEMELQTTSTFHELSKMKREVYRIHIQLQNIDSYKIIEERQLYSWDQIAGQVGGFLGLVVGASFISIIEIIAYLSLCLITKCCKLFMSTRDQ